MLHYLVHSMVHCAAKWVGEQIEESNKKSSQSKKQQTQKKK